MAAIVEVKRWFLIGPGDAVLGLRRELDRMGTSVVNIGRVVAIVTDGPLNDLATITQALRLTDDDRLTLLEG